MPGPLVLDLDGVLRLWDPAIIADAERDTGLPVGSLERAVFGNVVRLNRAVTGAITDEQWRQEISMELEASCGPGAREAVEQWSGPAGHVDYEVLAIVRRERSRRTVALFSNATTRLGSDLIRLGLTGEIDVVFNSSSLGVAKPSPGAFAAVLVGLGAAPGECLFVDDTVANTQSAARLGFRAHHYTGAPALEEFIASETGSSV